MRNDRAGDFLANARNVAQELCGGRVGIHTDMIYHGLDHGIQRFAQLALVYIVLVEPNTDALRIDLHQFPQGILQTSGDRDCAAHGDVQVRKLGASKVRSRIDGSSGFTHYDVCDTGCICVPGPRVTFCGLDQLCHEGLCLSAGSAIADRNDRYTVGLQQLLHDML